MININYNKQEEKLSLSLDALYSYYDNYGVSIFQSNFIEQLTDTPYVLSREYDSITGELRRGTSGVFNHLLSIRVNEFIVNKKIKFRISANGNCGFLVKKVGGTDIVGVGFGTFPSNELKEFVITEDIEIIYFMAKHTPIVDFYNACVSIDFIDNITVNRYYDNDVYVNGYPYRVFPEFKVVSNTVNILSGDIDVILYNNNNESIVVDKELVNPVTYHCTILNECSISEPVILLNSSIIFKNYCYIPKFNRYYYINDIISVKNNLWQLNLKVDVLMSFKQYILELDGKIERQEFNYSNELYDEELLFNYFPEKKVYNPVINDIRLNMDNPIFILRTAGGGSNVSVTSGFSTTYLLNKYGMYDFSRELWGKDATFWEKISHSIINPIDSVISIVCVPIDYDSFLSTINFQGSELGLNRNSVKVGDKEIEITNPQSIVLELWNITPVELQWCKFSIRDVNLPKFLYKQIDSWIYIPFLGEVKIESDKIFYDNNFDVFLSYILDFNTGNAVVQVKYSNIDCPNTTYNVNFGYSIPVTSTAWFALTRSLLSASANLITASLTSFSDKTVVPSKIAKTTKVRRNVKGVVTSVKTTTTKIPAQTKKTLDVTKLDNKIASIGTELLNSSMSGKVVGECSGNAFIHTLIDYSNNPYISLSIPSLINVENYNHLIGKPSTYSGKLKHLKGYTEIGAIHTKDFGYALLEEVEEIEVLLKSGIIL